MGRIQLNIALALCGALLLSAAACGGHAHKALMKGAIPLEPKAYTIQDALAELDALAKPEGVDAKVWGELKDALRKALECRARDEGNGSGELQFATASEVSRPGGRESLSTRKLALKPPSGAANKVKDLTAKRETNGDFTLSWHYRNLGDYNQNGVVGVSDITPLAMHYNETYDADAEPDCIQAVVDGSGNGKVGVEDVTQIAQCYGVTVAQYSVQSANIVAGPFAEDAVISVSQTALDTRKVMNSDLGENPQGYWQVAPMDGDGAFGEPSNIAGIALEIRSVTPVEAKEGTVVTFGAEFLGAGPFTYDWDFGGQAVPATSIEASPKVVLTRDTGGFPASVTISNPIGNATFPFTLSKLAREWKWEVISQGQLFSYQDMCLSDNKVWIYLGTPGWLTSASALLYSGTPENWQFEDVPYKNGQRMQVSASGIPSILGWYGPNYSSAEMYLTERAGSEWTQNLIITGPVSHMAELIIGADDNPLVTYVRTVSEPTERGELRFALRENGLWNDGLIDYVDGTAAAFGQRLEIAHSLDGTIGQCYLCSQAFTPAQLKYAQYDEGNQSWNVEIVTEASSEVSIAQKPLLGFDSEGRAAIVYNFTQFPNGNTAPYEHYLTYAVRDVFGWSTETIRSSLTDTEPDRSPFLGGLLSHDPLGEPLIVVFSEVSDERYMLWRDGSTWEVQNFPEELSGHGPINLAFTSAGTLFVLLIDEATGKEVVLARYE